MTDLTCSVLQAADYNISDDFTAILWGVGGVYSDRQLKTTRLPSSLESGRVITFETELIAANKVRVTVEVCEKVIIFDWNLPVQRAQLSDNEFNMGGLASIGGVGTSAGTDKVKLYFFTRLSSPGVSVTVD